MGQTSLPGLNRAGIFSFWNSLWDSKYQYPNYLTKFQYTEQFFIKFFKNPIFFYRFLSLKKNNKTPTYLFKAHQYLKNNENYSKEIIKYHLCTSKLWILKYGNWVILSIYIYDLGVKYDRQKKTKRGLKDLTNVRFLKGIEQKIIHGYNIIDFKKLFKRGAKNKRLLFKKSLKRLKKFFKFQLKFIDVNNKVFLKKVKILRKVLKKKKLKRRHKRNTLYKKTFLNTKITKLFFRKQLDLKKKNKIESLLYNNFYNVF